MPYAKKRTKTANLAKQVKSLKRVVGKPEVKTFDVTRAGTLVNRDGESIALSQVTQGDTQFTRDGGKITPLRIKGVVQVSNHASSGITWVRVVIVKAHNETAVNPIVDDVFKVGPDSNYIGSLRSVDARRKSTVIYDKTVRLSNVDGTSALFNISKKLTGEIRFSTGGSTTENGGYYLMLMSNIADLGNEPTISHNLRLYFTDN